MKHLMLVALFSILLISRADADDLSSFAYTSGQEVAATKKKLNSNDGIFNDINYSGTLIRPVREEERAPASVDVVDVESSPDSN